MDVRWRFYKRWSAVFFGGVGWPGDSMDALKDARGVGAGGFGFRYFLARLYGMHGGLDFAWSKEDFAWYITIGSYWH